MRAGFGFVVVAGFAGAEAAVAGAVDPPFNIVLTCARLLARLGV